MSSDFTKILVKDDRMECVDNIKYAVIKGGQNVTPSQFRAISVTNNQLVFNIQVPSEQTLIDRRVMLSTELTLTVVSQCLSFTTVSPSQAVIGTQAQQKGCGYGSCAGLAPYPLHQLMTVASATVNNNTVSINMRDVLPAIIRMLDKKELGSYNGMSATQTDTYQNYGDQAYADSGVFSNLGGLTTDYEGRSSIALVGYTTTAGTQTAGYVTEVFTWHLTEALMLSPFIYSNPKSNGQAFYGIQNMNIVLNIGDLSRVFRGCGPVNGCAAPTASNTAPVAGTGAVYSSPAGQYVVDGTSRAQALSLPYILSVTAGSTANGGKLFADNTFLFFTFLTAHPSDLFPARNIVPYYELPRYITTAEAVAPQASTANYATELSSYTPYNLLTGTSFTSQTLQLNQIPDKLLVYIRKQGQTFSDSDSYLPITGISIDFNNNSGLLSAARAEDLYKMSKDNGSNQNWSEWSGLRGSRARLASDGSYRPMTTSSLIGATTPSAGVFSSFPSCGGCLVLEFGKDIQLIEDFFAPGSLGNFNIRLNVSYLNNNPSIATASNIEMVLITMNSGVFVCERGTSSTYTGILTRADVLEASEQDAYTRSDVQRLVGGGFMDMIKSGVSKLAPLAKMVAPHAKEYLMSKGPLGQMAAHGMSAMGYGRSGGGGSGGRLEGRYA